MTKATHALVTHSEAARLNRIRFAGTHEECETRLARTMERIKSDSLRRAIVPIEQAHKMMTLNEMTLAQAGQHPELHL